MKQWKKLNGALLVLALMLGGCVSQPPSLPTNVPPTVRYEKAAWSQVEGWASDQPQEAWRAFLQTCKARGARAEWKTVCAAAMSETAVDAASTRRFFEKQFVAYRIIQAEGRRSVQTGMVTGYYEPLLRGSRKMSPAFSVPLYSPPADMLTVDLGDLYPELKGKRVRGRLEGRKVVPYFTRGQLDGNPSLKGHELVWVDDVVAAFFLEVQGSGRVQLNDGSTIRIAYADQNGQPYRSIGRYLVDLGEMTADQASAQSIRRWIELHPQRLREILNANPSVVFFREERLLDPEAGPVGALGVPLTAGRSIAVDPQFVPLGAPVFLATTQPNSDVPLQRLVMAQDTGGAIRGILRADLFWGFGDAAGESAGRMRQQGSMWILWPRDTAFPLQAASEK
ncbi:MAG: MltA domain-containing protein [Steroidobacteraceae bacterium]